MTCSDPIQSRRRNAHSLAAPFLDIRPVSIHFSRIERHRLSFELSQRVLSPYLRVSLPSSRATSPPPVSDAPHQRSLTSVTLFTPLAVIPWSPACFACIDASRINLYGPSRQPKLNPPYPPCSEYIRLDEERVV